MSYLTRHSKFRHVFGEAGKPDKCWKGVQSISGQPESPLLAGNTKFFGVSWQKGGGGALAILSLDQPARLASNIFMLKGHAGPIMSFDFNPFDEHQVATGSDDCTAKLYQIPEGGLTEDISDELVALNGHQKKVNLVKFHPVAEHILSTGSYDSSVRIWDLTQGVCASQLDFPDVPLSLAWNHQGSLLASTHKDKTLHVSDPRAGKTDVQVWEPHEGSKPVSCVWTGKTDAIISLGFNRQSEKMIKVWDRRNTSAPLCQAELGQSAGVMLPMWDEDTQVLFVGSKGETTVKYFELVMNDENAKTPADANKLYTLSQYAGQAQKGVCKLPKMAGDLQGCEIAKVLRLCGDTVEPVAMRVPRKATEFQDDLFPDTAAPEAALSAEEWLGGKDADPKMMSARPGQAQAPKKKTTKTVFQLQKECDEKDKRIAELEAQLAKLTNK